MLLYLNRGTIFFFDEAVWFGDLGEYPGFGSILRPHNGHLLGTTRLLYLGTSELFGADYLIQRVMGVIAVLACSGLFFALARRRVGNLLALAPALLLLVYGSAWQHVVDPIGFTVLISPAFGLAAFLALEHRGTRNDVLACAFVCLSVFSYTVGLGFVVGAAIYVLADRDRLRRAYIFLVPLAGYAAWWLSVRDLGQEDRTTLANLDRVPDFVSTAAATVSGGLTGLSIPFTRFGAGEADLFTAPPGVAGWVAAAALLAAVIWRISRGNVPASLWASLGVLATYWLAASLSDPLFLGEQADSIRYIYPASIGVLLVITDAFRGIRIPAAATAGALALIAFSIAMNVVFLRDGAAYLRDEYAPFKSEQLAMLELANGFNPGAGPTGAPGTPRPELADPIPFLGYGPGRDGYLAAVARYGSPADDLEDVRAATPEVRANADQALIQAYAIAPAAAPAPAGGRGCADSDAGTTDLPPGGAMIDVGGDAPVPLMLNRFGDAPGVESGRLEPGWSQLAIPTDVAADAWQITLPDGASARICPLVPA